MSPAPPPITTTGSGTASGKIADAVDETLSIVD